MKAATEKIIGLLICMAATGVYAQAPLPGCVLLTVGNCSGTLRYPNGDVYLGEFNYGKPNGNGKIIYSSGDIYVGKFYEGKKHGIGDYTWADGNRYIGNFYQGNLEGQGAYYFFASRKVNPDKYVGEFRNNKFNGVGVYTYSGGSALTGLFKDGKKVEESAISAKTEIQEKKPEVANNNASTLGSQQSSIDLNAAKDSSETSNIRENLALAEIQRLALENTKLKAQIDAQLESERNIRLQKEKELAALSLARENVERLNLENNKSKLNLETPVKVAPDKREITDAKVAVETKIVTPASAGSGLSSTQEQSKFFFSGSLNSVLYSLANVKLANGSIGEEKMNASPKNIPFGLGTGYYIGENYGLEVGYKYHGEQKPDGNISDDNFYKSSSLLFGGFIDFPTVSGFGLSLKAGIQNTDTSFKVSTLKYLGNGQYATAPTVYASSINVSNGYYGLGINYLLDKDNKIFLDWTRMRSSKLSNTTPTAVQEINIDITEFGLKHTF